MAKPTSLISFSLLDIFIIPSVHSLYYFVKIFVSTYFGKHVIGPIFIGANGQKLKNNLAIWAHWFEIDPPNRQLLKAHFVSISIVAKELIIPSECESELE